MSVLTDPPPYAVAAGAGAGASGASSAGTDSGPDANAINFDQFARQQQPQQYSDVIASGSGASEAVDNGELLAYEPPPSSSTASSATFALYSGQPTPSKEEYRDANWSVFFWLHLVVLFGASLLGFLIGSTSNDYSTGDNSYSDDSSSSGWTSSSSFTSGLLGTLFAGGACALLAIYAARRNTRVTIYFAMWSTVGLTALMAILCFALFSIFLGVLFALLAVFLGLFITRQTKRIGFATKIMKYSLECMFVYPATVTTSFGGLFAAVVWFVLWLIGLVGAIPPTLTSRTVYTYGYDSWSGEQYVTGQQTTVGASGLTYFVIIIYVFSLFWTCQVLQNVVGTTISGVAATWYFCYPVRQVVDPTRASFRRATTTSFGSVCLGSLVVGLLRTARFCLSMISTNNSCGECALFCGRWILKMLDSAFTYFNHYAFAQVAIYGKKYTTAACDTLELFKSRGLDAVLNDLFVGQAVAFLSLLSGLLTALVVLIVCSIASSSFTSAWAVLGMFVGYTISATALGVIENTVICFFVCLAEDPAALYATKPEIYNDIIGELQSTYPQAQVVEPNPAV